MITRRNLLKILGFAGIALSTPSVLADLFLSKQITRTNEIQKATVLNVIPTKISLHKVNLSGITVNAANNQVTYGVFVSNSQVYLIEDPSKMTIKQEDGTITLQPFRSKLIALGSMKDYWHHTLVEVASGSVIQSVEIKPAAQKVPGSNPPMPFFSINTETD